MDLQIKTFRIHNESDEAALNAFLHNKVIRHWSTTFVPDTTGALGAISSALTGNQSDTMTSAGSWNVFIAYEPRLNSDPRSNQRSGTNDRANGNQQKRGVDNRNGGANAQAGRPKEPRAPKEDYVPNVSEADMPLFEAVRKWRNARARDEKVKPFAFFNNRQLEEIVKAKPMNTSDLRVLLPDMEQPLYDRYHNELLGFLGAMHSADSMVSSDAPSEAATA